MAKRKHAEHIKPSTEAPALPEDRAVEALRLAKAAARKFTDWEELFNALYRPDGILSQLFTTPDERRAFRQTAAAGSVANLLAKAKNPPTEVTSEQGASGKLLVRLPKSLHAALLAEAAAEGASLNQLVIAKLAMHLHRSVESP